MDKFARYTSGNMTFLFKYDKVTPQLLHIYARHLTSPTDAVNTFFNGKTSWNSKYERFETYTDTHGLYWFWLKKDSLVMIISCFRQ